MIQDHERRKLDGVVASPGVAKGRLTVITGKFYDPQTLEEAERRVREGDILVVEATNPEWNALLMRVSGVVVNQGGFACHASKVARDLRVPCIVGAGRATDSLSSLDGQDVTLEATQLSLFEGVRPTAQKSMTELEHQAEAREW